VATWHLRIGHQRVGFASDPETNRVASRTSLPGALESG
jgi:hypothetical protein